METACIFSANDRGRMNGEPRRIARTGPVSSDSSFCPAPAGSDWVGSGMLVLESAGATALTKGHGRVGRPASLHIGQNPVNLLLNPAKTEAGLTNPRKRDGVEIATPSRQLTGARRRAHTQTKRLTSQSRNGNNSHQTR